MYSGGSGTELSPYIISTAQDLIDIENNLSAYFLMVNDIDLSSYSDWVPIGYDVGPFSGTFDGNGKKVKNLTFSSTHGDTSGPINFGLFDSIIDGHVSNLGIEDLSISYSGSFSCRFGGICAIISTNVYDSSIKKCFVTGNAYFSPSDSVSSGGLVGGIFGSTVLIENCWTDVAIECNLIPTDELVSIGGICALSQSHQATIKKCYAVGDIIGDGDPSSFDNVLAIGGICGKSDTATTGFVIEKCVSKMTSLSTNGGDSLYIRRISTIFKPSSISATPKITTIDNYALDTMITPNTPVSDLNGLDGLDKTASELQQQSTYEALGWDFDEIWIMEAGEPKLRDIFEINTEGALFFGTNF